MTSFPALSRRVGLLLLLASLVPAAMPERAVAQGTGDERYDLTISTATCSTSDGTTVLLCEALPGVAVTAVADSGDAYGTCVTQPAETQGGSSALCRVPVPDDSSGTVTLDPATIPPGYRVLTAPLVFSVPSTGDGGSASGQPDLRFTIVLDDEDTSSLESETLAIGAIICDAEEPGGAPSSDVNCEAFGDATVTVTDESGEVVGSCVLERFDTPNGGAAASCAVNVPFNATYTLTFDEAAIPSGYVLRENPVIFAAGNTESGGGDGPDITFALFIEPDGEEASGAEPTQSSEPTVEPGADGTGSPAAIYAGDCETDFATAGAVAVLSETTRPDGETQGADGAAAVETSFTTLDLPLDDILAEDHVLVVFDEDDAPVVLACGAIGGIVDEDGSLVFGLPDVGASRFSGVAYLTADGDQTLVTVFLAEGLSGDETPAA